MTTDIDRFQQCFISLPIRTYQSSSSLFLRAKLNTTCSSKRTDNSRVIATTKAQLSTSSQPTTTDLNNELYMKLHRLGESNLIVSQLCLGGNTWGLENDEQQVHEHLNYAISRGVNFIDTAEAYPTPRGYHKQTPGVSETILGSYLAKHRGIRSKLVIATKVLGPDEHLRLAAHRSGPSSNLEYCTRLNEKNIIAACNASLKRLQTNYIDLYYLHWPDRYVPIFGKREYKLSGERESVPIRETLLAIRQLLNAEKIRAYALSNETTFGLCEFVRIADQLGMPRPVAIQNSFSLLDRQFEGELAEACSPRNFNMPLLPYCPLGGGVLSGKYCGKLTTDGTIIPRSFSSKRAGRHTRFPDFQSRFVTPATLETTEKYKQIAEANGMSLATLALAFAKSRWFVTSTVVGSTSLQQLRENIDSFAVSLSPNVLNQIDEIHNQNKDPIIQT